MRNLRRVGLIAIAGVCAAGCVTGAPGGEDPRAADGVAFFGEICGKMIADWGPTLPDGRYGIFKMSKENAAKLGGSLADLTVYAVNSKATKVEILHYVTPSGICGVEIGQADQADIDRAFRIFLTQEASGLAKEVRLQSEDDEDGAHTRIWRLGDAFEVGLSSSGDPKRWPQHILTMARVREGHTDNPAAAGN